MKTGKGIYFVACPFTGSLVVEVEAESEEDAYHKADELVGQEGFDAGEIAEMEFHTIVCEGNIFRGVLNEREIAEFEPAMEGAPNVD